MTIERQERLYEVLVRYGRGEAGDLTVAAHQRRIVELVDTSTGEVLGASEQPAFALAVEDVGPVVGEVLPALAAERDAGLVREAKLSAALDERTAERDAAVADAAGKAAAMVEIKAQRDELFARLNVAATAGG